MIPDALPAWLILALKAGYATALAFALISAYDLVAIWRADRAPEWRLAPVSLILGIYAVGIVVGAFLFGEP